MVRLSDGQVQAHFAFTSAPPYTFKPSDLQTFGAPHLGHKVDFGQLAYQITWPSCVLSVKWLQQQRTPRIDDLTGLSGVERSLQLPFVQSFD